jgi:ATP-GRASP peptide maturase of grasp-with-spasm system
MKKKVLIISNNYDHSTNVVMDWIKHLGHEPIKINGNSFYENQSSFMQELSNLSDTISINIEGITLNANDVYSVWHRKDNSLDYKQNLEDLKNEDLKKTVLEHLEHEYNSSKNAFYSSLKSKKNLGLGVVQDFSKIDQLLKAKEVDIEIPYTIITNTKNQIKSLFGKFDRIITKPVRAVFVFNTQINSKELSFLTYTEIIKRSDMSKIPDNFFPSLFQEALQKEIEIRTFYLNGECYSMAIFSQMDEQTNVDFRMYNTKKMNRCVPYQLPTELEVKIAKLMKSLNLKTGSLDLVKTIDQRFVFLEVNPRGQYGMTSNPCNYNLDKKISEYLCS